MGRNLGPLNIKDSYEGLVQISGSQLTDGSGSLISSLDVTASYASNAGTSGYAGTAGFADTATSASWADQAGTSGFATTALSASFATTASFALNVSTPNLQEVTDEGATTTNDISISNRVYGQTGISSGNSGETYTVRGGTVNATLTLQGNDVASTNSIKLNPTTGVQISGSLGIQDDITIAGDLTGLASSVNVNSITASFASFTSASIGYLQTVTGSATIIGDAFIILNNDTPTQRYAGIVVQDSGSTAATASLFFDGVTNDWNYEYTSSGDPDNFGVVMFGPEYGTKGSPIYPTLNTIQKGGGGHHLLDSNITDDGSVTKVSSRLQTANANASGINSIATGNGSTASGNQASAIGGFNNNASGVQAFIAGGGLSSVTQQRGAVIGGYQHIVGAEDSVIIGGVNSDVLATHARSVVLGGTALATSKADEVVVPHLTISGSTIATDISASGYVSASTFIGDGSQLTGISSDPFPYTGSAEITGSLDVEGPVAFGAPGNVSTGVYSAVLGGGDVAVNSATGLNSVVLGGYGNTVSQAQSIVSGRQNTISGGQIHTIMGGLLNTINASSATNGIFNGKFATITGVAGNSAIIAGESSTISNHDFSVILGGQNLSTTKNSEVVVPSLSVYGETFISSSVLGTGSLIDNLGQQAIVTGSQVQHIVNLSQAEYDALTPDANTLYVIDGAETLGDTVISGSLIGEVGVLTDAAGTTTLDCSTGNYFTLAMPAGGTTALTPTNIQIGQTINIKITQNATASTLTYAASIDFPGGTAFTISTGSGEVDILTLVSFDGTSLQATGLANFS